MKTQNQMLDVAMAIANSSSVAYIGFFCRDVVAARRYIIGTLQRYYGAKFEYSPQTYRAAVGGAIHLLDTRPEDMTSIYGFQFSHVFYRAADYNIVCAQHFKTRIRSTEYYGNYPMGIYNEYYREVCSDY